MKQFIFCFFIFLFIACTFDDSSSNLKSYENYSESNEHLGFFLIHSKDNSITLGTKNEIAKPKEKPEMQVSFSYDYFIAKNEVTCKEYIELINNELLKESLKPYCLNDSLPIAEITFYDAVLFANEKSKKNHYDTAYTYSNATFDKEGHCINLEGYEFKPEIDAYRLPTEAEWVYAAKANYDTKNEWTSKNSNYKVHTICSHKNSSTRICDLTGNLKEWVNDWLGNFKDTTITNYIGAPNANEIGERIIKGGSFNNSPNAIKLYNRGDVYSITSSTKKDYVGFRLAFGSIPNPSWITNQGTVQTSKVTILVNSSTIRSLTKSLSSKLIFRNDVTGNLNLIDYSSANPSITEITNNINAYHPDISPDGNYVAFSTTFEGLSQKSTLYVKNITSKDSKPIKLNVESATIPRWFVTNDGDTTIIYVSSAKNNKDSTQFLKESTWQVNFSNNQFGTPKKIFDGNFHGGISYDLNFAITGSSLLRSRIVSKNSTINNTWFNKEQACNASLSKDNSKRTLFLDFGSEIGEKFENTHYNTHERIFIIDSTGKLINSISSPKGFSFDHTEWALGGNFSSSSLIIATLTNIDGAHKKIVLINLNDKIITEIVSGEEIWHPTIWSKTNLFDKNETPLDYDSAGIYYCEKSKFAAYELRAKMETFWTNPDSFNVVSFGSSRVLFGINERETSNIKLLNYGYSGGDFYGIHYLLKNYVINHMNKVKYIVLELTPNMFWRFISTDWDPIINDNPGYKYDENHDFWIKKIPNDFLEAVKSGPTFLDKESLPYKDEFTLPSNSWGDPEIFAAVDAMFFEDSLPQHNYKLFKEIVSMANKANYKVIALTMPVNPNYNKNEVYGPYGPSFNVAKQILDSIKTLDLTIMDEFNWGNHSYTDEMAYDADHLSYLGAKKLTKKLENFIEELEKQLTK